MMDYRLLTFMDLYKTMNYTQTARNLNITQPAVTQHIKYLEQKYEVKLFHYEKKHLDVTKEGHYLYQHALALRNNVDKIMYGVKHVNDDALYFHMGATLTIGEYLVPSFLVHLYKKLSHVELKLKMDNTESLLEDVRKGNIDFAFIEGLFNKEEFYTKRLKKEEMILVLPCGHELLEKRNVTIEDLLPYRILVREQGSGTRDILVQALMQYNLSLHNFSSYMEINHINTIKKLVEKGLGIAFLYRSAVTHELEEGELITCKVKGFTLMREFNMVSLKDSIFHETYDDLHRIFLESMNKQ